MRVEPDTTVNRALLEHTLVTSFLEHAPDSVYFKDCDSRFIAVSRSKAARHRLRPEDLVGKTDSDFFGEEHAQWARADEEGIINTGEPVIGKLERIVWPDGTVTWSHTTKLPLRDADGEIIGTFGMSRDLTADHENELALEKAKRNLLDTSRTAGMAEVATGVLHNVGNVLTSLNVAAAMIGMSLSQSKADSIARVSALLTEHTMDLGDYITTDPKGRRIPEFLESLAKHARDEEQALEREIATLQENIDHIKEIVSMQQAYATMMGVVEPLDPTLLVEDALRMNAGALVRHDITVVRDFHDVSPVMAERGKVLQILVNLVRNAKYACDERGGPEKIIRLIVEPGPAGYARIVVADNGTGIAPEHLPRIFEHGFTTRKEGHGFGLHSAALAAEDMKGKLRVESAGRAKGATFTLELPLAAAIQGQ